MTTQEQPVLHVLRHWLSTDPIGACIMTPGQAYLANKRMYHRDRLDNGDWIARWEVAPKRFDKWIQEI